MNGEKIRAGLLQDASEDGRRRRQLIALSAAGLVDFTIISLYQTGIIARLPDLPHPLFDSNSVNRSPEAYRFGVPDGPLSAGVYALTMTLAAAGGRSGDRNPALDVATGAAALGNAAGAAYYMYQMVFREKKVCLYCVAGALINFASAAIALPLMVKGLRRWRRG